MGQNQKFMKKLKIDFLRMSLILYLVSIQLYYVWVLDFRKISKGLWYLSSSWRFWNISSDTYFWLFGRHCLIYFPNLYRKPLKTTSQPKYDTLWIRFLAGNLIGGITYSQIQNFKTAQNLETKLRILVTDG
jgi:hypothetical protein